MRQKKRWEDKTIEWTGIELNDTLWKDESREEWRRLVAGDASLGSTNAESRDSSIDLSVFGGYPQNDTIKKQVQKNSVLRKVKH